MADAIKQLEGLRIRIARTCLPPKKALYAIPESWRDPCCRELLVAAGHAQQR
jgi:hypothetical protein